MASATRKLMFLQRGWLVHGIQCLNVRNHGRHNRLWMLAATAAVGTARNGRDNSNRGRLNCCLLNGSGRNRGDAAAVSSTVAVRRGGSTGPIHGGGSLIKSGSG